MLPAQQGLEPGDGAIFQPHDRLEKDLDLAAIQRAAQIALERGPVGALGAHRRREEFGAIAAAFLALTMAISASLRRSLPLAGSCGIEQRDADRHGERHFPFAKADRGRQIVADRFDDFADLAGVVVHHDDGAELVAGEARQRVARRADCAPGAARP